MLTAPQPKLFLATIPIFAGLQVSALSEIAEAAEEATFHAGDIVVREGEPGNRMFIVYSGRVEIVKHLAQPHETVLAVFGPKNFVGEMSMIECVDRSASVRAVDETL